MKLWNENCSLRLMVGAGDKLKTHRLFCEFAEFANCESDPKIVGSGFGSIQDGKVNVNDIIRRDEKVDVRYRVHGRDGLTFTE